MFKGEKDPAAALWAMANLATAMAIRVVATLRIADLLKEQPATAADLAGRVQVDPGALERLLRYLAQRGVLGRDQAGRYALTELAQVLRDDHPAGLRPWLDIEGPGRAELAFVQLKYSIETGKAAFDQHFGVSLWEDLAEDPARRQAFHARLSAQARERASQMVGAYPWGDLGHVMDVGGGDGSLVATLLGAHPGLCGTVLDLPGTAEVATRTLAEAGVLPRGQVVAGDFFTEVPAGAGGYLLSLVTHNWDDGAVTAVLRRCAQAAGTTGKVLIIERVDKYGEPHTGMDLRMLVYTGGRERGVAELAALAAPAGLTRRGVHPAGELTIIEFGVA